MAATAEKSVLILGSGLVTPCLFEYLDQNNIKVLVGSRNIETAKSQIAGLKYAEAHLLDVENDDGKALLEKLAPTVDGIVSMLPYLLHPVAAAAAMKYKKHFFTTSYATDVMRSHDATAKENGKIIINECGVDPGTDHMSAMRVIHQVQKGGGKITSFTSYCGGLPAPDCNDNPFGYKLSWAPRGVLLASRNAAHFLKNGSEVDIEGKDLFDNFELESVEGLGDFESYPNRNSVTYKDIYQIPQVQTMIRGTYRYKGWCPTIKKMADVGLLDLTERSDLAGTTYSAFLANVVGADASASGEQVRAAVAKKLGIETSSYILDNFAWMGLFDEKETIPAGINTYLDALCVQFKKRLVYAPGERDMILMKHKFTAEYSDRTEYLSSTLVAYGKKNGATSMAQTVGYPVAIAIRLVLEGKIKLTGFHIPIIPEIYNPILDELETMDIKFIDKVDKVVKK